MPTDSAHHAQRPRQFPIPCHWEAAAELSVCWGLFPESSKLPSFRRSLCRGRRRSLSVGRGPQSQRTPAAGEKASICVAAGKGQRCSSSSIRAQGQSGTACSSTVPGLQTGEVRHAFSAGWAGDACPSPAQQTRPVPLSLAFAFLFIYLLGGGSLVLGTESHISQANKLTM